MRVIVGVLVCMLFLYGCSGLFSPQAAPQSPGELQKVLFSPDGKDLALVYSHAAYIYDSRNLSLLKTFPADCCSIQDFIWLADGRAVIAQSSGSGNNYSLLFWDAGHSLTLHALNVPVAPAGTMSLASHDKHLALSYVLSTADFFNQAHGIYVIDTTTYEPVEIMATSWDAVTAYSPDGKYLEVHLNPAVLNEYVFYSTATYAPVGNLSNSGMFSLDWYPDGKALAGINLSYESATVFLTRFSVQGTNGFNLVASEETPLMPIYGEILEAKFSPDGRYLATGSYYVSAPAPEVQPIVSYGVIDVFDTKTKKIVFHQKAANGDDHVYFDWSPDGRLAYLYSGEGVSDLRMVGTANFTGG